MNNPKIEPRTDLKALFLLGTLKRAPKLSNTEALSEILINNLKKFNVRSEVIRLVEFNILPGVENNMGKNDAWPKILKKILGADIIIFATPIWWSSQSSVMQRVIERMDALNDELLETGKSELANKVGGIVITGAEDGAQHIIGNISNFMIWNGLTLPPACSLSFLGYIPAKTKKELVKKFGQQKSTVSMSATMARNLVFFANLLKLNPMPQDKKGINQNITEGAVGLKGNTQ